MLRTLASGLVDSLADEEKDWILRKRVGFGLGVMEMD